MDIDHRLSIFLFDRIADLFINRHDDDNNHEIPRALALLNNDISA